MVKEKKVKYCSESGLSEKDVQKYGIELDKIKSKYNNLNINIILKEAKNKENPLHNYFEWDNTKAGIKYREHQARMLVASIKTVVVIDDVATKQRAYYSVRQNNNESKYVTLKEVVRNKSYRDEILNKAITHLDNVMLFLKMLKEN